MTKKNKEQSRLQSCYPFSHRISSESKVDKDTQAKRRARSRKQENCYKGAKEKDKRLVSEYIEVVKNVSPNIAKKCMKHRSSSSSPRYHLNALTKLRVFADGSAEKSLTI